MHKYSVAVIIPCFNSSKYIRKTIESVMNQDYEYLEIIAIDDGSSDETRMILEGYLPKIRILSHPNNANCGEGASLNLGISQTKSDLIAFLDSDDVWHSGKVREQVEIFGKYPDVGLVYTNGYTIDEDDNKLYRLLPDDFREKNIPGEILVACYISTSSAVMVRREIFDQIGLFKTHLYATDHDMWIRISEVAKFYHVPKSLTAYRRHSDQKSSKRQMWEDGFIILKEAYDRYPYNVNLKRKRKAVLYYRLGEHDWNHNNYSRSFLNYSLAGMLDPLKALKVVAKRMIELNFHTK